MTGSPHTVSADAVLAALARNLGDAGTVAAAALPGLLAEIDQHAAVVRDRLTDGVRRPGPVALAGYVEGLCATAAALGWPVPDVRALDWSRASWLVLRLLAVCQLAAGSA